MTVLMRGGYVMRQVAADAPPEPRRQPTQPMLPMRAPEQRHTPVRQQGHIAPPGYGPAGETCGSCAHAIGIRTRSQKTFAKCELNRRNWTHGAASDIRRKDPACVRWSKGE